MQKTSSFSTACGEFLLSFLLLAFPCISHCSRHSCATLLLSSGVELQNVQAQLGHKRMATTEIYAKLLNSARSATANKMDEIADDIF